jgi:phosphate transport system substrate-binding protein
MMKFCCCLVLIAGLFFSCTNNNVDKTEFDTPSKGTINISVDESFKPVIEEQIKVYESSFLNAKINATYKPEVECLKDLDNDSVRMVIVSRGLSKNEVKLFEDQYQYKPQFAVLAYDAIAVIVNRNGKDSLFTMKELRNILNGNSKKNFKIVVDGKQSTSTVRYLIDSVLLGDTLSNKIMAGKNSQDVLDFVSTNEDAIGFIGLSWIGNPEDLEQMAYLKKVRLALIECKICEEGYYSKPSTQTISKSQYNLVRGLYYILKENRTGLGTGFLNFMSLERGQLIFRRSYLIPAKMNFNRRLTKIKEVNN